MEAKLYYNKSDKRYIHKKIEQVGALLDVQLIEPTDIMNPDIILSKNTQVMKANYIWLKDFNRFYYINDYTFEYDRIIAHCHVDVLMSHKDEIMQENVILDRMTPQKKLQNYYLLDEEIKNLAYPFIETHEMTCVYGDEFNQDKVYFILGIAGAVGGSNEGGEN